jgi:subtilisin-like proprotein convertase family protein
VTVHPPTTLTPLVDQTLCFGTTATFSTTPSGTGPFTFTWKKNGLVLAGQTTNTLTLPRVQASDAGTYSVEASGLCNSASSSATLAIESQGLVSPATFANPAPITINDFSAGSPYPSTIDISCVSGPLSQLSVTLTNVSHTYASDIDILLVGPSGQAIMLMSDTGGANGLTNATLTFSDSSLNFLPQNGPITSGVYKPTDYPPEDNMPVPAPLPPYATNLAAFSGTDANGTWSLYVVDDALMDTGMIAGGWSLTLSWTSALAVQPVAPVLVSQAPAGMTLQGQAGQCYVIEASTDLVTWTPILTNTLITTSCYLVDVNRTNFTHRFYRAVTRP